MIPLDVIDEFEKAYPNIHVNYTTYDSNETMYSKLKTGGISVRRHHPFGLHDRPDDR